MRRAILAALVASLVFAPAAHAHHVVLVKGGTLAHAASVIPAGAVIAEGVEIPAEWSDTADRLAREFAAVNGYGDACADRAITHLVVSNLPDLIPDHSATSGVAWVTEAENPPCVDAVGPSELANRCAYLRVAIHERLHLARNDIWHSTEPSNPLSPSYYAPGCEPVVAPQPPPVYGAITRSEAKRFITARLNRHWKVSTCGVAATDNRIESVVVCASKRPTRHGHASKVTQGRIYTVIRLLVSGQLSVREFTSGKFV